MSLAPLKLVLTAAGCPGASTLIGRLKANGEREIVIHGVDMRPDAVGRFMCDGFSLVPAGASPEYIPALTEVVAREHPDILFVQSSHEIETVARSRDVFEELGARVPEDRARGRVHVQEPAARQGDPDDPLRVLVDEERFAGGGRAECPFGVARLGDVGHGPPDPDDRPARVAHHLALVVQVALGAIDPDGRVVELP